jgi:hypothetical protein
MDISVHQFLTIYAWFGLGALLFLLMLIARFYERLSGKRTYYRYFAVPVVAFTAATVRQAQIDQVAGDAWANLSLFVGGVSLGTLCVHVYRLMTSGR